MARLALILVVWLGCAASVANADTIVLKDGGRYDGRITSETKETVTLKHALLGTLHVARSKIRYVLRDTPTVRPEVPPTPAEPPESAPTPGGPASSLPISALAGPAVGLLADYRKQLAERGHSVDTALVRRYLKKMSKLGPDATPALARALVEERDWRMRLLAVRALAPLEAPEAIPALTVALGDPFIGGFAVGNASRSIDKHVIRVHAVEALRALGKKAEGQLRRMAVERNTRTQLHAVNGLRMLDVKGREQVLIPVARDKLLTAEVRSAALRGLVKQGHEAHKVMAELLRVADLRKAAAAGLKFSKDKGVIPMLLGYVRGAAVDPALAHEAAVAIGWTDGAWRPSILRDHVDYLLLRMPPAKIRAELSQHALPRLHYWASSPNASMRARAKRALAAYAS